MTTPTYLEKRNPHERDSHITFEEEAHKYTIDGEDDFLSVTTWNHGHFEKFNADKIIDKMMSGKNWTKSGMSVAAFAVTSGPFFPQGGYYRVGSCPTLLDASEERGNRWQNRHHPSGGWKSSAMA